MDRKKELLVRMYLVMLAFVVLSIVIVARVAKVSILEGDKWRAKSDRNVQLRPVYAERGNIYSEEYNLLATSLKFFEIHMDLTVVAEDVFRSNVDSLAHRLSRTSWSAKSKQEWLADLRRARRDKKRYYRIAKKINIDQYNELKTFPILRKGRFKGGLIEHKFERRTKPFKSLASRTIGEDRKNATKIGLEGYFDKALSGETREILMKKITANNDWIPVYDMSEMEQRRGDDVVTTINVAMQDIMHHEVLSRAVELKAKAEWHGLGLVTMQRAFEKSSNVGIAKLTHEFYNNEKGREKFVEKLGQFGLTEKLGIEIAGEPTPYIKHPKKDKKKWYGTTIPWMSHGYELLMTPLQMLSLYNTVANDGVLMKPYLVSDIVNDDEVVKHFEPRVLRSSIAKASAIADAQTLLKGVVQQGTGKKLQSEVVSIAGKTGTTRTNYAKKSEKKAYNASFAGYFPADDPRYSMIVIMYEPQGSAFYGASAAGPAYKRIAERITAMGVTQEHKTAADLIASNDLPSRNAGFKEDFVQVFDYAGVSYKTKSGSRWVEVDPNELKMNIDKKRISTTAVPDVRGMGARDAIYVLENLGLAVDVVGVGKVVKQTIKPGTKIKGQDVTVYLN